MADKEALDRSSFVRRLVLRNPTLTAEKALDEWNRAKMPVSDKPNLDQMRQLVSTARYTIKGKYGLNNIEDLPIKKNGEPNVSELLRLLMRKHADLTEDQARYYLRVDGLTFTPPLWTMIKKKVAEDRQAKSQTASPDPNQSKGPRARYKGKPGRKTKSQTDSPRKNTKKAEEYLSIEHQLDELMLRAQNILDSELAQKIRAARNHTIVEAYKLV